MKKYMKAVLLSFAIAGSCFYGTRIWARNETRLSGLSVGDPGTQIYTVNLPTAPASNTDWNGGDQPSPNKTFESRRTVVTNTGKILVFQGVNYTTATSALSSTNTQINDGAFYSGQSTATTWNPNVLAVAYASEPFYLGGLYFGNGCNQERVRLWDSRGDTSTAIAFDLIGSSLTSPVNLNVFFSSGVTLMKNGTGFITVTGESTHQQ